MAKSTIAKAPAKTAKSAKIIEAHEEREAHEAREEHEAHDAHEAHEEHEAREELHDPDEEPAPVKATKPTKSTSLKKSKAVDKSDKAVKPAVKPAGKLVKPDSDTEENEKSESERERERESDDDSDVDGKRAGKPRVVAEPVYLDDGDVLKVRYDVMKQSKFIGEFATRQLYHMISHHSKLYAKTANSWYDSNYYQSHENLASSQPNVNSKIAVEKIIKDGDDNDVLTTKFPTLKKIASFSVSIRNALCVVLMLMIEDAINAADEIGKKTDEKILCDIICKTSAGSTLRMSPFIYAFVDSAAVDGAAYDDVIDAKMAYEFPLQVFLQGLTDGDKRKDHMTSNVVKLVSRVFLKFVNLFVGSLVGGLISKAIVNNTEKTALSIPALVVRAQHLVDFMITANMFMSKHTQVSPLIFEYTCESAELLQLVAPTMTAITKTHKAEIAASKSGKTTARTSKTGRVTKPDINVADVINDDAITQDAPVRPSKKATAAR